MIVCICKNVSEKDIAAAVADGCGSYSKLQAELGVAQACGKCARSARACFREQSAACQQQAGAREPSSLIARIFAPRETRAR